MPGPGARLHLPYGQWPAADRLLCLNLGRDLPLTAAAEPLLAPPEGAHWRLLWSSEAIRYGGAGTAEFDPADRWVLPGHSALVFGSVR